MATYLTIANRVLNDLNEVELTYKIKCDKKYMKPIKNNKQNNTGRKL